MTTSSPAQFPDRQLEAAAIRSAVGDSAAARAKGIVLTPPELTLQLAQATLPETSDRVLRVLDPACGTGRLLAGAAQVAAERGLVLDLHGIELEPDLAEVSRQSLPSACIRTGDALATVGSDERFDIVLLNPPYRGRMRRSDAHADERLQALHTRFGAMLGPYADPSTGFVLLAESLLEPAGRLGAIVPVSMVSARDAAAARDHLASTCRTIDCWSASVAFEAQVHTACLVLERRTSKTVDACDWPTRLATAAGVPLIDNPNGPTIGSLATVTADFRDEYYALKGHVVECADDDTAAPLLTCGLIDPGMHWHGVRPARVYGQRWTAPGVLRHEAVTAQLDARLVPKVLVATQTSVIESVADPQGLLMPGTPVIRVVPHEPSDVWRLAVSLHAPQASALALHRHFGAGRAPSTLRLRAADIAALPLTPCGEALDRAIEALQSLTGDTLATGTLACAQAWGPVSDELLDWWTSRLPRTLR